MTPEERQEIRKKRVEETFQLDPVVSIKLKQKDYTLEANNYAIKGILKDTAVNLMDTGFRKEQMNDPLLMGSMLFWLLRTNHPEMTQEESDKMYSFRHYAYVLQRLNIALDLFLPDMSDIDAQMARERMEAEGREGADGEKDPTKELTASGSDTIRLVAL